MASATSDTVNSSDLNMALSKNFLNVVAEVLFLSLRHRFETPLGCWVAKTLLYCLLGMVDIS